MSKTAIDAQRGTVFILDPEDVVLVTDPASPLYDPRVHDDPDESMVRNIMVYGVIEPIIVRKDGEAVEVVAGRGRVKAAREANRRLTAEGKQPIRVPAMLRRGQDADMFGVLISENECRREDNPLLKSVKAQRLIDMGKSTEEVAVVFGVSRQSVEAWLNLGEVAQPVLDAVERGEISATAAAQLHTLPREEQVKTFEAMKEEGGKVTVQRAKQAVRKDDAEGDAAPKPKMMSRQDIESQLSFTTMHVRDAEINVEFYEGVKNALQWVLGLGCVWLPIKGEKQTEEGLNKVYMYGTWEPVYLPADAPLVAVQDADKAGWCKDCPLAAHSHVMMSGHRAHEYDKFCSRPLLERGLMDLDRLMESSGCGAQDDDYVRAAAMLGLPTKEAEAV